MTDNEQTIHQRLARLEALEEIRRLKNRYADVCDNGYDGSAFAELFTIDGVWESNTFGTITGREDLRAFIDKIGDEEFSWAIHFMRCLDVVVSQEVATACGTWQLLQLSTRKAAEESEPIIATAIYRDELVRTDSGWKFSKVSVTFHHVADFRQGWGPSVLPGIGA
ncbi:nuclear transport factor 2 family protein [Rhodococcus erythropolis]|uniref:nuclear transport factor 2 family protein n=1 Tax=Rhodococcus erythropolis TaxID=1833 RepID=UPI0037A842D0